MAKKKESFFFIPPNPEQAQVNLPRYRSGSGKFDPDTNKPINESGWVAESQARESIGMLGQGGVGLTGGHGGRPVQATGRNLGAMGYMNSEIIIAIQISYPSFFQYQMMARQELSDLNDRHLLDIVTQVIYRPLHTFMLNLINSPNGPVPKDSGRLRNAMELSIGGGHYSGGGSNSQIGSLNPFYVILNTGKVPYAPVVNRMQTSWLQHFGATHRGYSGQSNRTGRRVRQKPHTLLDPGATIYWFQSVRDQSRQFAMQLWQNQMTGGQLANEMAPIIRYYQNLKPIPVNMTAQQLLQGLLAVRFS
jgi:hypothetical protein